MSQALEAWLDYAWDVISNDGSVAGHRSECEHLGGAFCGERCAPKDVTLRYPGYMGADYENGRTMLVGAVHNGNALFSEPFRRVESAMLTWRSAGRSTGTDAAYLDQVRLGYENAMPTWGPWRNGFGRVLNALNLEAKNIVYTNVAKCWSKPREPSRIGGNQDDLLMEFCLMESEYGIISLVEMLRPLQIYVSARNVYRAVEQWSSWSMSAERVWTFNANTGALLRGNELELSLRDAVKQYTALKGCAPPRRAVKIAQLRALQNRTPPGGQFKIAHLM